MLNYQFFGQNFHFVTGLFTALVCFAVFWLYFDAWTGRRMRKDLLKWLGFAALSVSYLCYAVLIEQPIFGGNGITAVARSFDVALRLAGYVLIILGQIFDPLQPVPKTSGLELSEESNDEHDASSNLSLLFGVALPLKFLLPLGALGVAWQYFRHATTGLERHLKPVAVAFAVFTVADLLDVIQTVYASTVNPIVYNLVAPFGWLWQAHQVVLLAGAVVLGIWVWRYLIDRFVTQLFMIFTVMIISVFLVITVCFTFLLTRNVQAEATTNLQTTARTLNYAVEAKEEQTKAAASIIGHDPAVVRAVAAGDHQALVATNTNVLSTYHLSSLIITDDTGKVLLRAQDPRHWADSISSDTLLRRALIGVDRTSVRVSSGLAAPQLNFISSYPIRDGKGQIIGAVLATIRGDNSMVDGIKKSTGLNSSLYAGNIRSATTLTTSSGKRDIGTIEASTAVNKQVLQQGRLYSGPLTVLNQSYEGVYAPLKDVDNSVVGMLFVGRPEVEILALAGRSIQMTFAVATVLLILSILPAYLTARYLSRQL